MAEQAHFDRANWLRFSYGVIVILAGVAGLVAALLIVTTRISTPA